MQTNPFPLLDEPVSRLGFGAYGLGGAFGAFDKNEAIDALHACWQRGVNLVDTARHYGPSEQIIGEAMKVWKGPKPFIATKAEAIGPIEQWAIPRPVEVCFPRGHITREADASLSALGVDSIDLLQMHLYWANWGLEGYWLDELESRPDDFCMRRDLFPIVYLPIGLCEPHGHIAALGLDLLKAEYYCEQAADRFGGVVAPAQGYHIHECGFHAPWLAEVVGEENPLLAAVPPHVMLHLFLYQLRAFALAGFKGVIAVSGHAGGSQNDLRLVANAFTEKTALPVIVKTDPEWIPHLHAGDHAGRYEISQLMDIRPDLVDLSLLDRRFAANSGGRLAVGEDAAESSAAYGHALNEAIIAAIGEAAVGLVKAEVPIVSIDSLSYEAMERIWQLLYSTISNWSSVSPWPTQPTVPASSRWHAYVHVASILAPRDRPNTL